MKTWITGAVVAAMLAAGVPTPADAARLGGGKSSGMQRNMPARIAPQTPPAKPATPPAQQQATPGTPATAPAAAAAAAPAKRSWMGPIAGLAAGLGLAALMSHLGMGAGFANFLMIALLAIAGVMLVMFLVRRFGAGKQAPRAAMAGGPAGGLDTGRPLGTEPTGSWPAASQREALPPLDAPASAGAPAATTPSSSAAGLASGASAAVDRATDDAAPAGPAVPPVFVPASFDSEAFARTAKLIFIRLQAANDSADLDDLRTFTTPELFAELRLAIQERGNAPQHTDVVKVDADVLDVANEDGRQVVSVRFRGQVVESTGAQPVDFNEIWHMVRPLDDSRAWAIAGIEQSH